MKLIRKSIVPKGAEIPEGEDGFVIEQIAENKSDEIRILEEEALKTITSIIGKVEAVTGHVLNISTLPGMTRNRGD